MNIRIALLLALPLIYALLASGQNPDLVYLKALMDSWQNVPPNWVGSDPCGDKWDGISCSDDSRVTSIILLNINLTGPLSGDIGQLTELQTLDLSYNKGLTGSLTPKIGKLKKLSQLNLIGCGFNGPLPQTLGHLSQLTSLNLNFNDFTGPIPPSIGNLSNLYVLDLSDNKLSGSIPVSVGATPGLDLLFNARHFHFGRNRLSGEIPSQLFNSKMTLIHVLFEDNQLTGTIPSTLGLLQNLEVLRLDRNLLSGDIPSSINNLKLLTQLYLSNNKFVGVVPNVTSMTVLNYLDMSNNSFEPSKIPPWLSSLQSLTTLMMQDTGLQGEVPVDLFHIPHIQTIVLRNNQLDGTLDFGESYSESLRLVDMSNNSISAFPQRRSSADLILISNPVCKGLEATATYCHDPKESNSTYSTPPNNCIPAATCSSDQISSPNCKCSYPFIGTLTFKATSISDLGNSTIFTSIQRSMMETFNSNQLPVDSVSVSNPTMNSVYFVMKLEIFPSGDERFNRSGICGIGFVFTNQTFRPPPSFGPYTFLGNTYSFFSDTPTGKHEPISKGVIVGISVGVCVLMLLFFIAGIYAYHQKGRAERAIKMKSPFASWDHDKDSGGCPQLKELRSFTFEELNTCTNSFAATANIGSGGYGMVYRGTLPNGQLVAIKRSQDGSTQGGIEFKTEIELLSRVHHKNLVSLVGFCLDAGEQMLVYEYIVNGSLKDSLSGKSGIRLDWMRRLKIILGAARGLQYLHDHADPPIIHRDVKSTNILLDGHLNAKVSDFGLSKPLHDVDHKHVTTHVKGTMGYIDPEYYMTQELTEKSDVYSFGVVMLELITARNPIQNGKYIVRVVKESMDDNLRDILDPTIGLSTQLQGLERFIDVALRCVEETVNRRPKMSEVVKEIENIMELAGINPMVESTSTSESYGWQSNGDDSLERSHLYA